VSGMYVYMYVLHYNHVGRFRLDKVCIKHFVMFETNGALLNGLGFLLINRIIYIISRYFKTSKQCNLGMVSLSSIAFTEICGQLKSTSTPL
jgi:hypothetical protein